VRFELVALYEAQGNQLQEVSELLELLEVAPEDQTVLRRIGRLLLDAGAAAQAAEVFRGLTESNTRQPELFQSLGEAEYGRGHYLSARTAFARSLSLDPASAEALRWLRLCNRIVELDPTYRRVGTLERHRRSERLLEGAIAELERCFEPVEGDGESEEATSPAPERILSLIDSSKRQLSRQTPPGASEEAVEINISLAEAVWLARQGTCPEISPEDEALGPVLAKLDQ
jgi:tetratricopeptide (TPR) repeat protein